MNNKGYLAVMPTSGIRVLLIGPYVQLPYEVRHLPKIKDVLENVATFKPHVILTIGARSGVLAATTYALHKRWLHFDTAPSTETLIQEIETLHDHNIFDRNIGDDTWPLVSIYTPTFNTGVFLQEAYESLRSQTYPTFEWVVVDDGSDDATWAELEQLAKRDPRVRPFRLGMHDGCIGALKDMATRLCRGELFVEFDHDDRLTENALADIVTAFKSDSRVGFVYSDYAAVFEDGTPHRYPADWAWPWNDPKRYYEQEYHGRKLLVCNQMDIYDVFGTENFQQQFGWYLTVGPHHVRAFRAETFRQLGGYNPNLPVADDWDLMSRFFINSRCLHIPKLCYIYRVRDAYGNATFDRNQAIQDYLELARRRRAADFERTFKQRLRALKRGRGQGIIGPIERSASAGKDTIAVVIASRQIEDASALCTQLKLYAEIPVEVAVLAGHDSIFEAYEAGRMQFKGYRRVVYLHDDIEIQDVPRFLQAIRACGPGLYGVIGSGAPNALESLEPWWTQLPPVGHVLQRFPDGSIAPLPEQPNPTTTASLLDGLCLVAVDQTWSWLLPGNPPLWHGYDWLACKRTNDNNGRIGILPQAEGPLLLHRGYGRSEGLSEGLHSVHALARTVDERRDYENIVDHLPMLKAYAKGAVLELGSREGVSTSALLEGVVEKGGQVWSVDYDPACAEAWYGHPRWHFVCGDSTSPETAAALAAAGLPEKIDLLFVDTEHTYAQVTRELNFWLPRLTPTGTVLVHDTESFPEVAQAIKDAAMTFDLSIEFRSGCNGLAIIRNGTHRDVVSDEGARCDCTGHQGVQGVQGSCIGWQGIYKPLTLEAISYVVLDATASPNAEQCLTSIVKFSPGSEIILVGNGIESTAAARALATRYLQLEGNIGFAAGCNRGAKLATNRSASATVLCFMNDDAQFVDAETPKRLLATSTPESGWCIAAPYTNRGKPPQGNWASLDQVPSETRKAEMVTGMCMMLSKYHFERVGGFDTRFTTWEDDDLCQRLAQPAYIVGGTWVDHKGSQTFQALKLDPQEVIRANGRLYQQKHPKVRVIAIAKDEEAALEGFTAQFRGTPIHILDTGSTDNTIEKARRAGVEVQTAPGLVGEAGFAYARNDALERFAGDSDWIIMLDPDERLDPQTLQHLPELLFNAKHDIYLAPLIAVYPDGSRREFVAKPFLFRNTPEICWAFKVHEKVIGSHKQALIANGRIEHILALHEGPRRQKAEGLYQDLAAREPYFTDPAYKARMREEWPILDYDRPSDPRIADVGLGPLVSVIIPTHKRPELLAKAVASAQAQTWSNLEIIVVGDCDPTLTLASSPPGLRVINLPQNYGAGGAVPRNVGIQAAQGSFIAYLDDDNEWTPDHVASVMAGILTAGASWGFSSMEVEGTDLGFGGPPVHGRIDTSCVIHRKELFDKHGPWKNRSAATYSHDWELFSRWLDAKEPWAATARPTMKYGLGACGQAEFLRQMTDARKAGLL
jgi:glycosyltransferase involved in cell wall biosynthesis